jgi:hypothetical protein
MASVAMVGSFFVDEWVGSPPETDSGNEWKIACCAGVIRAHFLAEPQRVFAPTETIDDQFCYGPS